MDVIYLVILVIFRGVPVGSTSLDPQAMHWRHKSPVLSIPHFS